ncbi:MAG: DUF4174 domain-containing protein [Ginsengibacter sp.]
MHMLISLIISFILLSNEMGKFSGERQLLIFGQPNTQQVVQQLELLKKDATGVKERDIIVTLVAKENSLWKKYSVDASKPLTVILVGKDGGEKHRTNDVITAQQLYTIVDGMPMRQAEMRDKRPRQ